MLLIGGWHALVRGIYPPTPKEDPDFYRESVVINGRQVWGDMLTPRTAQALSLAAGAVMLLAGVLWLLYILQVWPFHAVGVKF